MKTLAFAFVLVLILFAQGGFAGPQSAQADGKEILSRQEAIEIMRAINTAEAESLALAKHALNMQAVKEQRFVKKLGAQISLNNQLGLDSSLVKNYEVRLLVGQDQQHYTLTLRSLEQAECASIYMTNETGVMYQGVPASCQESPASN